jgi:hypothetical protein
MNLVKGVPIPGINHAERICDIALGQIRIYDYGKNDKMLRLILIQISSMRLKPLMIPLEGKTGLEFE